MKYEYKFKLADTVIKLQVPQKLKINDAYACFQVKNMQPDFTILFMTWDEAQFFEEGKEVFRGGYSVYKVSSQYVIKLLNPDTGVPYFYMVLTENKNQLIGYVKKSEWWRFTEVSQIFNAVGWERIINRKASFLLHASYIAWRQQAILFTAPSGTGKSTQADLWKQYENVEIINGDKAALSFSEGIWKAHGLPVAGSSGIYVNKTYPVRAIVVLRQGKENHLNKMKPIEAFRWIYSETIVQYWDKVFLNNLLDLLNNLVEQIPVYMLECLPEQSAVELLKKELELEYE